MDFLRPKPKVEAPKKKTLFELAKETPPQPPPSQPSKPSEPSTSSTNILPQTPKSEDTKTPSSEKLPDIPSKDADTKEKDSKQMPQSSDEPKTSTKENKKDKATDDKNKKTDDKASKPAQEESRPPTTSDPPKPTTESQQPPPKDPPKSSTVSPPPTDNEKKNDVIKPDEKPTTSDDSKYPMPPEGNKPSDTKPEDSKEKSEDKKPAKKKGFFSKLFGKEENEEPEKVEEPKKEESPKDEKKDEPPEEPKKDDGQPKTPSKEITKDLAPEPLPDSEKKDAKTKPDDASKENSVAPEIKPAEIPGTSGDGSEKVETPSKDIKSDGKPEMPDDSKYPMPPSDDSKYPMPPSDDKPRQPKTGEKKPEKKKVGFFDKMFGKDEEPQEKDKSPKDEKKPETTEPKKSGGFFSNIFKKDEESKAPKEDLSDKKEEKPAIEEQPEGKDDANQEASTSNQKKEAEKVGGVTGTDKEEREESGFVIEDEIIEEEPIVAPKKKRRIKPQPDVKDEFESGDAYLVGKVGHPHFKDLVLNPKLNDRFGGHLTNCERCLGIVPGRFAEHHEKKADPDALKGIYVWGLIPRGPADKAGIELGQWIVAIDDKDVNSNNFHEVVRDVENFVKVKLKLQKVLLQFDSSHKPRRSLKQTDPDTDLKHAALVTDVSFGSEQTSFRERPHCVLFLKNHIRSKDLQEYDAKEDVVYSYPNIPSNNLMDFRGSFLTLQSLVPFLAGSQVESTSLEWNNVRIWVSHHPSDGGLLLIFFPSNGFSNLQLRQYSVDIKKLIELLFSSIESAFTNTLNHARLDELFANIFMTIFSPGDGLTFTDKFNLSVFREDFVDSSANSRSIIIDQNLKVLIDGHLSEFESESFGNISEDYYGSRKMFDVIGTSFYYKGYLISSHIPYEHLYSINTILKYNNILSHCNSEQLGNFYFWSEVFFDNKRNDTSNHDKAKTSSRNIRHFNISQRFESSFHRNFILMLSADNSVLVTLLSCSDNSFNLIGKVPSVDLFLLNRLKFTLSQLSITGVLDSIEYLINGSGRPCLSSVEWFLKKPKSKVVEKISDKFKKLFKKKEEPKMVATTTGGTSQTDLTEPRQFAGRQMSDSNLYLRSQFEESETFKEEEADDNDSRGESYFVVKKSSTDNKISSSKLRLNKMSDIIEAGKHPLPISFSPRVKLNSGYDSTVFNYAYVDDNIIVTPPQQQIMSQASLTQAEVMQKFNESCLLIRSFFEKNRDQFGEEVVEHGTLFRCNRVVTKGSSKNADEQMEYWVVGRRIRNPGGKHSEFYACFHDSCQQNAVEMAFKLMQGTCPV